MATIGSLVFQMSADVARLQQDMAKAQAIVKVATDGMQSAIAVTKNAFGLLGVSMSTSGIISFVEGGIQAQAALKRLSDQSGVAVEALSALKGVAKISGTDMEQVALGAEKLSRNMLEMASTGKGKAAQAFQDLGVSVRDSNGKLRDSDKVMQEVAKKLFDMENATQRVAYAQLLFGKAGAQLLPFLRELAEAGELHGKVTTAQAEAAKHFEDNLLRLKGGMNELKMELATGLLPQMNAFTDSLVKARKEGGLLSAVIANMFLSGNEAENPGETLNKLRAGLDGMIKTREELSKPTTANKLNDWIFGDVRDLDAQIAITQKKIEQLKSLQRDQVLGKSGGFLDARDLQAKAPKLDVPIHEKAEKDGVAALSAYEQEWNKLISMMREADKAANGVAASVLHALNAGDFGKVTVEQRKQLLNLAAQIEYDQERIKGQKELAEGMRKNTEDEARRAEQTAREIQHQNELLEQQAQHWKDIIDPLEPYRRQLEQISELATQSKLTSEEWSASIEHVTKKMDELGKVTEEAKKTQDWARDMGLTFESAFENAIVRGKSFRDVLSGIGQDIARIITRETITAPMGKAISGAIGGSGIGDFFKGIFGGSGGGGLPEQLSGPGMPVFPQAGGGDYLVNKPTLFLAGEAGPERARFGDSASGGGDSRPMVVHNWNVTCNDARGFLQMLSQPSAQRFIRGAVEQGFARNGIVSGMAAG